MSIWRWADWIEHVPEEARTTLGEGDTPLIRSKRIGPEAGLRNLFLKLEAANPTGSFKDRFAAAAISHMVARGQHTCVATSSGNAGSSLAAYCAAADVSCRIAIVETAPNAPAADPSPPHESSLMSQPSTTGMSRYQSSAGTFQR